MKGAARLVMQALRCLGLQQVVRPLKHLPVNVPSLLPNSISAQAAHSDQAAEAGAGEARAREALISFPLQLIQRSTFYFTVSPNRAHNY